MISISTYVHMYTMLIIPIKLSLDIITWFNSERKHANKTRISETIDMTLHSSEKSSANNQDSELRPNVVKHRLISAALRVNTNPYVISHS